MYFSQLSQLIKHSFGQANDQRPLHLSGVAPSQFSFFLKHFLENGTLFQNQDLLLIYPTAEEAEEAFELFDQKINGRDVALFTGLEISPYRGILSSEQTLLQRMKTLSGLTTPNRAPCIIITTGEGALLKLPPPSFFLKNSLKIAENDIISPQELATTLVNLGYISSISVEEPGTFSKKGEIFDIYPINHPPVRIHYFDTLLESIKKIDPETKKTIKDVPNLTSLLLSPAPGNLLSSNAQVLRESIPMPPPSHKKRFERRKQIFNSVGVKILFDDYPSHFSLFFKPDERCSLINYLAPQATTVLVESSRIDQEIVEYLETLRVDHDGNEADPQNENVLPAPENLYFSSLAFSKKEKSQFLMTNEVSLHSSSMSDKENIVPLHIEKTSIYLSRSIGPTTDRYAFVKAVFQLLRNEFQNNGTILVGTKNQSALEEIRFLLAENELLNTATNRIHFLSDINIPGFYYPSEKTLLLTEADLFSAKKSKVLKESKKNLDLFAEQISTLKVGDYVVHAEFGIGKYLGLESISVAGGAGDFIVILYDDNDKVYVPVYRMNLVQKQADANHEHKLASLRSNKFEQAKERAKAAAKKLAFDFVRLQAERASSSAFAFSPPDHLYREFELAFPYKETPDQENAIISVLETMQKAIPMDHLVCGDVGFGKTEVAMRAAFKAVLDKKQVAVLVPTTILALQHFHTFTERMKNFPVNIEFLSRFKSPKESAIIMGKVKEGNIDIIIGTHKLLASSITFNDLGLIIIDEEQRFGVAHKEKLKLFKSSVDVLTLTATPIPRTLQMAFLGLRDLSLIQTPPPKRQSIKTYVIKDDDHTIQEAIKKEIQRGGQVFYVHNRVHDMGLLEEKIKELVPEASVVIAHGQMSEKDLERKMEDFYHGKFQVLLSTTIIESGLDIPNANTMIVDRADTFGLSQLHQLRGRIGRSDKKAYAYFSIPNNRNLTPIANERLKALQTYADMGAGFSIASSDLELRGAGDLLGAEQSGHIESVGLELYMELLKDAIAELKGEKKSFRTNLEIITPDPAYIPAHYIPEDSERLKIYKRISNCSTTKDLFEMQEEIIDLFGPYPDPVKELFFVLECRISLQNSALKSMKILPVNITLQFDKNLLESNEKLRNRIVEYFLSRPKVYKFTPDYRVIYSPTKQITRGEILRFAQEIQKELLLQ